MFKAITLLLALGAITASASAQRGICPQGNNQNRTCRRVVTDPVIPAPVATSRRGQGNRQVARTPGRFSRQGAADQGGRGRGNGRGRGARRGNGPGFGQGVGQGQGRGRGARRGPGRGFGQGFGLGQGRGRGQGARWNDVSSSDQPSAAVGGRYCVAGGRRFVQTPAAAPPTATTTTSTSAPTIPPDEARVWIDRLQTVLEAELYAKEYYLAAARALNGPPRFQNLARAEDNHANAIAYAIGTLGGTPSWVQSETITPPQTVAEADAHCEELELHVIDVYDGLITDAPNSQLLTIFQNIQRANFKHLLVVGG